MWAMFLGPFAAIITINHQLEKGTVMRDLTIRSVVTATLLGLMAVMLPWSYALGSTPSDAAKIGPPVSDPAAGHRKDARDVRVSPDNSAGSYRRLDGTTDAAHEACSTSRRQQQEMSVAVNPSNPKVIAVGTMDACISYRNPLPLPQASNWASYYRSTDGGNTWSASLMPGYPGDASQPFETECVIQADPALAFDKEGRLFYGALCPVFTGDLIPADFHIAVATFEDDGARMVRQVRVDRETGAITDRPALAVDQTDGPHAGNLYVTWTECPGPVPCLPGAWPLKFALSTDHGASFSDPITLSPPGSGAFYLAAMTVGPDGAIYVAFRSGYFEGERDMYVVKSTDGGQSFTPPQLVEQVAHFNSFQFVGGNSADPYGNCGDGAFKCNSGFTFPSIQSVHSIAADSHGVHLTWSAELPNGQAKIFVRNSPDGLSWPEPAFTIDSIPVGHQFLPDMSSADGILRVLFYDTRADAGYSPDRPPGNTAAGTNSGPSLDVFVASSEDGGLTWDERQLTSVSSQPGLETYHDARAPWIGDYISLSAVPGKAFAVWTDLRDIVTGDDTRPDSADNGFDVFAPCNWLPNTVHGPTTYAAPPASDACLSQGGLDSNIYGSRLEIGNHERDDEDKHPKDVGGALLDDQDAPHRAPV